MLLLLSLSLAAQADCPIRRVRAPGEALGAEFAGQWLQNSTLVERLPAPECETGVGIRIRSNPGLYADGQALVGKMLCVRMEEPALKGVVGNRLLRPGDSHPVGPIDASCHLPGRLDLRDINLEAAIPLSPAAHSTWKSIRRKVDSLYGGIDPYRIRVDDWGRAELPTLSPRSPEEMAEEYMREGLDTVERQSRAVTAFGISLQDASGGRQPAYAHFLGTDSAGSDLWGQPDVILSLLQLTHDWMGWCQGPLHTDPARCTLMIGDIAWFNGKRPDPLGHKDHWPGRCVDIRLFRKDSSRYEAWWNKPDDRPGYGEVYDQTLTAAFISWTREHYPVGDLYFNDPAVPGVKPWPGHADHIHLCLEKG